MKNENRILKLFGILILLCGIQTCGEAQGEGELGTYRRLLVDREVEASGYGLHSYLLFGKRSGTKQERALFQATIEAYLGILEASEVEGLLEREAMNLIWLPIKSPVPETGANRTADQFLNAYDYGYARALLRRLPGEYTRGPYIVSVRTPLSLSDTAPERILFQDLSGIDPRLAKLWVEEFMRQARRPNFWQQNNARIFALRLRDSISKLAEGLNIVISAAELNKRLANR